MRPFIATLAISAALAVAGCGSSGGYSSGSSTPKPTPASGGGVVQIALQNIQFAPSSTTAKVGQTITWTNKDSVAHNVTAVKGEEFKSKTLNQGDTYSYKLDKPGTITYVCTFHANMKATVTVTK